MKKLLLASVLFFSLTTAQAQIMVTEDFETSNGVPSGWSGPRFSGARSYNSPEHVCGGSRSVYANTSYRRTSASLATPNYTSNGSELTFSFTFKVIEDSWQAADTFQANAYVLKLQYSTDNGGNWVDKENANITTGPVCNEKSITFVNGEIPAGNVKFRLYTERISTNFYLVIDNISITQAGGAAADCPAGISFTEPYSGCGNLGGKISWNAINDATSYHLKVGTTSGANDIFDGDLTTTEYTLASSIPGQTYYYTVTATNATGTSTGCTEQSHTMPNNICYCMATSNNPGDNYIKSFKTTYALTNITNENSGYASSGYQDFSTTELSTYAGNVINYAVGASQSYTKAIIWIDFNNNKSFEEDEKVVTESNTSSSSENNIISGNFTIPAGTANGSYRMRVRSYYGLSSTPEGCGNSNYGETEDYTVVVTDAPSCPPAANLNATLSENHGVSLSWSGDATANYKIEWGEEGFTQGEGTIVDATGTSHTITNFPTTNKNYTFYVKRDCGTEQSGWSAPKTIHVGYCLPEPASSETINIPKVTILNKEYTQSTDAVSANHYNDPVDANAGTTIPISIDFGASSSSSNQYFGIWLDSNKDFVFDNNTEKITAENVTSLPTTRTINVDLPSTLTEGIYHLRIFVGSSLYLKNDPCYSFTFLKGVILDYAINITTNPICLPVFDLDTANLENHGKKLTWNGNNGTSFDIEYGNEGFTHGQGTLVQNLTATEYTIASLPVQEGYYEFYVKNNCGNDWTGPHKFYHKYCDAVPASVDGQGISKVTINGQEYTQGAVPYANHTETPVNVVAGTETPINITFNTSRSYKTYIWVDLNNNLEFEESEKLYVNENVPNNNPYVLAANITLPANTADGDYRMRILCRDNFFSNPPSTSCYSGSYATVLDYTLNVGALTCTPMTFGNNVVVPDCDNKQFSINVEVTGLGDGQNIITDGTNPQTITTTGTYTFGPYESGASVTITAPHGTDSVCNATVGTFTYKCALSCDNPIKIETLPYEHQSSTANYTNSISSSDVANSSVLCASNYILGNDAFYAFTPTENLVNVTFTLSDLSENYAGIQILDGCYNNAATSCIGSAKNSYSKNNLVINNVTLNEGVTYYIWISTYATPSPATTDYKLSISAGSLSTVNQELENIKIYPNPATDFINISSADKIDNISIFDTNGKRVRHLNVDNFNTKINIENLASGTYFITLKAGNKVSTEQIIVE